MSTETDWTQTFFTGLMVEALRRIPYQTDAELAFLREVLEPRSGDRILDVPCGTGRLTVPLAEQGFRMTGVDISPEALGDGRKAAAEKKLEIDFEQRDMRDLPWTDHFDRAYCFGNSFSYLGEDGNLKFLRAVHRALKPGGRFALETYFVAECLFGQLMQKRWYPFDDMYFLHDTSYDPVTARLTSSYTVIRGAEVEQRTAVYNVYTYREILRLFGSAGFIDFRTYGSMTREPFRLGAPGFFLVCRKPG